MQLLILWGFNRLNDLCHFDNHLVHVENICSWNSLHENILKMEQENVNYKLEFEEYISNKYFSFHDFSQSSVILVITSVHCLSVTNGDGCQYSCKMNVTIEFSVLIFPRMSYFINFLKKVILVITSLHCPFFEKWWHVSIFMQNECHY